jgi:hypothetical protein
MIRCPGNGPAANVNHANVTDANATRANVTRAARYFITPASSFCTLPPPALPR